MVRRVSTVSTHTVATAQVVMLGECVRLVRSSFLCCVLLPMSLAIVDVLKNKSTLYGNRMVLLNGHTTILNFSNVSCQSAVV